MSEIVKDVMRSGVITVPADTLIGEVARRLIEHGIHALFVEDGSGQIAGVIADIDLLAGEWLFKDQESLDVLRAMTAGELMSSPISSVDSSEAVAPIARRMIQERIRRLLVTEGSRPAGVISVSDIVRALASQPVVRRTVQEAMSRAIVVCRQDTPLAAVARSMSERYSRSVVVVASSGAPTGIITGTDLLPSVWSGDLDRAVVADVMHEPITIGPEASLREAADQMITHYIHRLLVVDPAEPDSIPLGLISTSDIIYEMAQPGSAWQTG